MPRGRPPKKLLDEFGDDPINLISRRLNPLPEQRAAQERARLAGQSERIVLSDEDLTPQSNRIILSDADLAPTVNRNEPWDSDQYVMGGQADTKLDPIIVENNEVIAPRLAGTKPVTAAYDIDDDAIGQVVNPVDFERPPIQYDVDPWEAPIYVEKESPSLHEKHRAAQEANPTIKPADFGVDPKTGMGTRPPVPTGEMPNWTGEGFAQPDLFGNVEVIERPASQTGYVSPESMAQPRLAGQPGVFRQLWDGAVSGYTQQQQNPKSKFNDNRYSRSLVDDAIEAVKPKEFVQPTLPGFEEVYPRSTAYRVGEAVGRLAGDIHGFGTQSKFWNIHPLDLTSTQAFEYLKSQNIDPRVARGGAYTAALALGVGSNNFNPLNLMEGGRQAGFEAISADENDPRQSTNPVMDMVFHRGMLGRTGKLLPWEEFRQERPNVSYDQYEAYKEYLRDPGMMGLVKGTWEGVDGPEARIMGYRVTPLGAIAALGTVGGVAMLAGRRRK